MRGGSNLRAQQEFRRSKAENNGNHARARARNQPGSVTSMSHQVLARKWRPRAFADVIGQDHVVRALANALDTGRIHHAYLLTGTRGVGKTTLARILAKALNCETGVTSRPCGQCRACVEIDAGRFVDLLEVDAATNTKVDEMRELLETAQYAPVSGRYKVYIIDEVHMLSKSAFNAMLKTLEEPPGHVEFILATTDPQRLPITVLSRCLQFNLKNLPAGLIAKHLAIVLGTEGIPFEPPALELIGRAAEGSVRDSLSLLDQAIAHGAGKVGIDNVSEMLGALDQSYLFTLLRALASCDASALIRQVDQLGERSISFDNALRDMAHLLSRIALVQGAGSEAVEGPDAASLRDLATRLPVELVQVFFQIALLGRRDLALAPDEQTGFTMTLLRMLAFAGGYSRPAQNLAPSRAVAAAAPPAYLSAASSAITIQETTKAETPVAPFGVADIDNWASFVARLQLNGLAGMLAKQSTMLSYTNGVLELELPPEQKHLAERIYVDKLKSELQPRLAGNLRINVRIGGSAVASLAAQETAAQNNRQLAAEQSIREDGFIQALRTEFGAEIPAASVRPASDS
ncbi:MAG TPA: DNA polymerase III subunit gamma/tau [Usitatibacteraceae bacterium]|nr:DNA polymerase III subunit gamma/tau [Usitatibacteraceae bacterium]